MISTSVIPLTDVVLMFIYFLGRNPVYSSTLYYKFPLHPISTFLFSGSNFSNLIKLLTFHVPIWRVYSFLGGLLRSSPFQKVWMGVYFTSRIFYPRGGHRCCFYLGYLKVFNSVVSRCFLQLVVHPPLGTFCNLEDNILQSQIAHPPSKEPAGTW